MKKSLSLCLVICIILGFSISSSLLVSASDVPVDSIVFDSEAEFLKFTNELKTNSAHNHNTLLRHGPSSYRWIGFQEWCPRVSSVKHIYQQYWKECGFVGTTQNCGYSEFTGTSKYDCNYGCR